LKFTEIEFQKFYRKRLVWTQSLKGLAFAIRKINARLHQS